MAMERSIDSALVPSTAARQECKNVQIQAIRSNVAHEEYVESEVPTSQRTGIPSPVENALQWENPWSERAEPSNAQPSDFREDTK